MTKLKIVNVSWTEDLTTVVLESAGGEEFTRAEAMVVVDRLEKYLDGGGSLADLPVSAPVVSEVKKVRKKEAALVDYPPSVMAMDIEVPDPRQMALMERQMADAAIPSDLLPIPVKQVPHPKDTGQSLEALANQMATRKHEEVPAVVDEDEAEMALGMFEDNFSEVCITEDAIRVWAENQPLFGKYPSIRERSRMLLSAHLGRKLGKSPQEASELIKAMITAKSAPVAATYVAAPVAAHSPQASAFLLKLGSDPKQLIGTAVKLACEVMGGETKTVTVKLVEDFLVSMVGKHPLLTDADLIRGLVQSPRFKLFASAGKVKVIDPA